MPFQNAGNQSRRAAGMQGHLGAVSRGVARVHFPQSYIHRTHSRADCAPHYDVLCGAPLLKRGGVCYKTYASHCDLLASLAFETCRRISKPSPVSRPVEAHTGHDLGLSGIRSPRQWGTRRGANAFHPGICPASSKWAAEHPDNARAVSRPMTTSGEGLAILRYPIIHSFEGTACSACQLPQNLAQSFGVNVTTATGRAAQSSRLLCVDALYMELAAT